MLCYSVVSVFCVLCTVFCIYSICIAHTTHALVRMYSACCKDTAHRCWHSCFRVFSPIAHCTLRSLTWLQYWKAGVSVQLHQWNSRETPPFQYWNHVSDCSVQFETTAHTYVQHMLHYTTGYNVSLYCIVQEVCEQVYCCKDFCGVTA